MKAGHVNLEVKKSGLFINKENSFFNATLIFLCRVTVVQVDAGKLHVQQLSLMATLMTMFNIKVPAPGKGKWEFAAEKKPQLLLSSTARAFLSSKSPI